MATVIFIKEGQQNRSAMCAVINYCQQQYKTFDSRSKRRLLSEVSVGKGYEVSILMNATYQQFISA